MFVDTHVHLNHDDLHNDLAGVVARAEEAGVRRFVVVGWDLASSEFAVNIAETDARFFATVGVHPHNAAKWNDGLADALRVLLAHPKVVAVGEIGLDYYRNLSPVEAQKAAFAAQIEIARAARLPIVIHCREAYADTLEILEREATSAYPANRVPVLLHCFQGTPREAARATAHGWFLGVGGSITYKNSDDGRAVVRSAPRDLLLLETDAPYLSPVPFRGQFPNEPARVALVAEKIAELREETVEEVGKYTTRNAARLFPKLDK